MSCVLVAGLLGGVAVPLVSDTYELPRPTGLVELEALGVTVSFTEADLQ